MHKENVNYSKNKATNLDLGRGMLQHTQMQQWVATIVDLDAVGVLQQARM